MSAGGQLFALTPEAHATAIASALGHGRERRSGATWITYCPVHEPNGEGNPDLDVDVKDGKVLVICRSRGCSQDAIITELKARGLWPDRPERRTLTLAEYAEAKKLTVEFLRENDVTQAKSYNQPVLHFGYRNEDGSRAPRYRVRVAMGKNFYWDKGSAEPTVAYGLHRLPAERAKGAKAWVAFV